MDLTLFQTTDEDGNTVDLPRPETKSADDVEQVIAHAPGNTEVIARFMDMKNLGDQWDWFESYRQWEEHVAAIEAFNDARVADEETGELPPAQTPDEAPVRPVSVDGLDQLKAIKNKAINDWADQQLSAIVSLYPATEVSSWDEQKLEALALKADSNADAVLLDAMAVSRGIDRADLVDKVLLKADAFGAFSGQVFGMRQKLESQLEAATTVEELNQVILP